MIRRHAPSWVKPFAKFDLDFANNRYWGGEIAHSGGTNRQGLFDSQAASGGYAPDASGILRAFMANRPRITAGMGLWVEQARTNSCLWCRDFTNAVWVKTNVTATKNQVGADGVANGASLLAATAANGTVLQTITLASAVSVVSAYIRRVSGTGVVEMTQDGGTTWANITSQLGSGSFLQCKIASATILNPQVGFRIASSGDSIAVDFFQQESGVNPTTPLLTTSAAFIRYNEVIMLNSGNGNVNDGLRIIRNIFTYGGPWAMYGEYSGTPPAGAGWFLSSDGNVVIKGGCDGGPLLFRGSTTANNGVAGLGNINKIAGRVNGLGAQGVINGGALATLASGTNDKPVPPSTVFTHCSVGNNGAGNNGGPVNGFIRRLAFWDRDISDGQLVEMTR